MSVNQDLDGKTIVITGGNAGIGRETARVLAHRGAHVVITARNPEKGGEARAAIADETGATVDLLLSDFAKLDDVRALGEAIVERYEKLDVIVHNAGLVLSDATRTVDGFETTFQVNHLAPFLLNGLLQTRLEESAPSRVVVVSSHAHKSTGSLDLERITGQGAGGLEGYSAFRAYGQSKLCNLLFTRALAKRLEGKGVTANALHPGSVQTNIAQDGDTKGFLAVAWKVMTPFLKTVETGAKTSIHLAADPGVADVTGAYFEISGRGPRVAKPAKFALDDAAAERLWARSNALLGTAF